MQGPGKHAPLLLLLSLALAASLASAPAMAQLTVSVHITIRQVKGVSYTRVGEASFSFTLTGTYGSSGTAYFHDVVEVTVDNEAYMLVSGSAHVVVDGVVYGPGSTVHLTPGRHSVGFLTRGQPGTSFAKTVMIEFQPPLVGLAIQYSWLLLPAGGLAAVAVGAWLLLRSERWSRLLTKPLVPLYLMLVTPAQAMRSGKRKAILGLLRRRPGLTVRRIARQLGIALSEVQWHLNVLERVGLVESMVVSKWRAYYPVGTPLEEWLYNFLVETGCRIPRHAVEQKLRALEDLIRRGARMAQIRRVVGC